MIDTAIALDQTFGTPLAQVIFVVLGVAFIVGLLFGERINIRRDGEKGKYLRGRSFRICATLLFVLVGAAFGIVGFVRLAANEDIDSKLESGVHSIVIDGKFISESSTLIQALMIRCDTKFRRSHPTVRYEALIETRLGPLKLEFGQDSGNSKEYWIFHPGFQLTRTNEVRRACDTGVALRDVAR